MVILAGTAQRAIKVPGVPLFNAHKRVIGPKGTWNAQSNRPLRYLEGMLRVTGYAQTKETLHKTISTEFQYDIKSLTVTLTVLSG
jgi:hypothetical protein